MLFRWMEKSWKMVACDQTPNTLEDWMEYQLRRMRSREILTWGVYLDDDLAGYLEMRPHVITVLDPNTKEVCLVPAIDYVADGHGIFKREMYGHDNTQTAINLVLQEIFAGGIEIMQFALFSHNRLMIALHKMLGGHFGGDLGSPVTQNGEPVAMELWVLTKHEWAKAITDAAQDSERDESPFDFEQSLPLGLGKVRYENLVRAAQMREQ